MNQLLKFTTPSRYAELLQLSVFIFIVQDANKQQWAGLPISTRTGNAWGINILLIQVLWKARPKTPQSSLQKQSLLSPNWLVCQLNVGVVCICPLGLWNMLDHGTVLNHSHF